MKIVAPYLINLLIHALEEDNHAFHPLNLQKMMRKIHVNVLTDIQSIRFCLQELFVPVNMKSTIKSEIT